MHVYRSSGTCFFVCILRQGGEEAVVHRRKKLVWWALVAFVMTVFWGDGPAAGAVGSPLQPLIDEARPGDVLELGEGVYRGPVRIDKPLTLLGTGQTVIDGGGQGPVITVEADDVRLEGLIIRHAGNGALEEKAGLVLRGSRAAIRHNRFEHCLYGIIVRESEDSRIVANRFDGFPRQPVHQLGNAIDLDLSHRNVIADNRIDGFRDGVYMERSHGNEMTRNTVTRSRYGFHFMIRSDSNTVSRNEVAHSLIGILVMESDDIRMSDNILHGNRSYQGYGAILYDTRGSQMRDNVLGDNFIGLKLEKAYANRIEGNTLVGNQLALDVTADTADNVIVRNQFLANQWQVRHAGSWKNALDDGEIGNFWDDYTGMDRDGDGIGDVPHETERWFSYLSQRHPALQLYDHSPAVAALMSAAVGGEDTPVDAHPLARPLAVETQETRSILWGRAALFGAIFSLALVGFIMGLRKERG